MRSLAPWTPTALAVVALVAPGCGGSSSSGSAAKPVDPNGPEVSPPGDIPDNQAFVAYSPAGGGFTVKVPEGWARTATASGVTFTDKLNAVTVNKPVAGAAPSTARATSTDIPRLAKTVKGFAAPHASIVTRTAGPVLRITYLADSAADPVTGRTHRNAVERFVFYRSGRRAVLTLGGPTGADNVDPWKIVSDSFRWAR